MFISGRKSVTQKKGVEQPSISTNNNNFGFETPEYPPYSSDLSPSDSSLLTPKEALSGLIEHGRSNKDVCLKHGRSGCGAEVWLQVQSKTFYQEGIRKLVTRWTKYTIQGGDYIEK
ncbi:hypothetical protein NPIL_116041 [Nephila pilipes]|uniref:Uncharacterized protein n=1 Tax=Nephila pilipes TaxID=299642 RepID=A0A8X6PRF0_NEPPI|nr:hypothetical protein NPIL_116041 [Nephila pilipes]